MINFKLGILQTQLKLSRQLSKASMRKMGKKGFWGAYMGYLCLFQRMLFPPIRIMRLRRRRRGRHHRLTQRRSSHVSCPSSLHVTREGCHVIATAIIMTAIYYLVLVYIRKFNCGDHAVNSPVKLSEMARRKWASASAAGK